MKNLTLAIIAAAGLLTTLASCHRHNNDPHAGRETIDVAEAQVSPLTLYNDYPGYLTAKTSVDVVAKVNGQIISKNYSSGAYVEKGQVLFRIDPAPYRDLVDQSASRLSTAQSTLEYAREHYEAVKKALESDAVSKMEVVQARSAYEEAQASVRSATAALETARRNLGYCTVVAPISGNITTDMINAGNYVSGQASPVTLAKIYDNSSMTANFAIEDRRYLDLLKSESGKGAINLDSVPVVFTEELPHAYTGHVSYMAPSLSQSTGTLAMQCEIPNRWNELRAGMYVKIRLPYARLDSAVLVRDASISTDQLGKYLYVVNDSNRVVYTPVKLGDTYRDSLRIVVSGIRPGERYVTKAMLKVRDGMTVNPRLTK